jgi:hypothetical protein
MIKSFRYSASKYNYLRSERSATIGIFILLAAASITPVLVTPIPAMVDYVNHLARMYVVSQNGTQDANQYYVVAWALYPNLAMDLLVPWVGRFLGVESAARLFLLSSQLLIVGGAIALEIVVKGRSQFAGFTALLFLYCLPFSWGFLNFEFGLGVTLWAIASYLLAEDAKWPLRLAINSMFVALLFIAHLFALGIYGATLGFYELGRAYERRSPFSETATRLAVLAIPALVLFSIMRSTGGSVGSEGTDWFFAFKPLWLLRIVNGYSLSASAASSLAIMILIYVAVRCRLLRFRPSGLWIASGFAGLYLAIPSKLLGTAFVDLRLIPAAAVILPAFCLLSLPTRRSRFVALATVSGIILINLSVVLAVWLSYRTEYAAIIRSFDRLAPKSFVLSGSTEDVGDPPFGDLTAYPMYYAPTLAVHYAGAFVPNLFTEIGKQPVQPETAVRRLAIPYGGPPPLSVLRAVIENSTTGVYVPRFVENWQRDYDYLYLLGPHVANPFPDILTELAVSKRFTLYKVVHSASREPSDHD